VSGKLGWRSVKALLDTAPPGMAERVGREVETVDGVLDCHRVRIRPSGPQHFIDFHVTMDGSRTLEATHALVVVVEARVRDLVPGADVTVHVDPLSVVPPVRSCLAGVGGPRGPGPEGASPTTAHAPGSGHPGPESDRPPSSKEPR
jgi:divalent metal cation (Fe/Co/Zn/Cd) transporter